MALYKIKQSSSSYALVFFMTDSTDHISAKTGLSPTVTLSKNGGSFSSPSGSVTEIANGFYKVAGNSTDANTLGPLILHATATGADPSDSIYEVIAQDPQDSVRFGLTAIPNATAGANGGLAAIDSSLRTLAKVDTYSTSQDPATYILTTPANKINTNSSGQVAVQSGITKNVAINNFQFLMIDSSDHVSPKTGLTITATRSIDGAAFGSCTNSASELANGIYTINLSTSDLNGTVITLKFAATGADTRYITLLTTPA